MPRILVADDNTNIQKMVALAFEERGIDVVSVGNGEAAVRRIPDLSPDLVLADVFMPVRNGYEVCEFVKKDGRFSHVPVILLVGAFDPLDEKEARRVGADGVLKKPFVPPDPLIAMVTSALEKNPRIAAEMSKAREVPAPPPAPEAPAPVQEAPARIEPTPLPEFPEPSPEEAADIYGFGKGHGRLGEEEGEEPPAPKEIRVEEADEAEDAFDGAATTSDWRRNASNFEVPEEVGSKFAFAPDQELNPVSFRSEADLASKPEPVAETQEPEAVEYNLSSHESAPQNIASVIPEIPRIVPPRIEDTPMAEAAVSANAESTTTPEPSTEKSKLKSWMDAIATPSEYSEGGWMSAIFGGRSKDKTKKEATEAAAPEPVSEAEAVAETLSTPQVPVAHAPAHHAETNAATEKPAFTRSAPAAEDSWLSPPPPPVMSAHTESVAASLSAWPEPVPAEPTDELVAAPLEPSGSLRDPELELPAAPHVAPEPLLVQEEERAEPSPFSGALEQPEPLHEFMTPAPIELPVGQAAHEEPPAEEPFNTSVFAPAESASVINASDERVPTTPPPNREAISDIPFLTLPPPEPTETDAPHSHQTPSVDTVVAKVLEKLEPQLHDLLARGLLKPLVENLLQQELAKKEK